MPGGSLVEVQAIALGARRPRSRRSILKSRVASALCVVPALYCGGCLLFALWNASTYAAAWPQFLRYVAAPGLLFALFMGVALFGSRVGRVTLGGMGIALLLGMFAFEARMEGRYAAALEELADVPSALWMTQEGVAQGLPPARTPRRLNDDMRVARLQDATLSGVPDARVMLCSRGDQAVVYRADRYGFRNPDAIHDAPVDRMLLGDSFVEGICLPDAQDLVGRARALRPATVGLGIRGAGPLFELAMLGRFGPVIRPKWTVIVFYEGNDWENLEHELRFGWLDDALDKHPRFGPAIMPAAQRAGIERMLATWDAGGPVEATLELRKSNLLRNTLALHQTWTQLGLGYPKVAPTMPVYGDILARTRAIAAGWGGRVALMYVPQTSRLIGLFPDGFVYDEIRDQVTAAAARNGIPMIDLSPAFAADPHRLSLYGHDGHFSERGAALAASVLDRALNAEDRSK
jgi:hypothetical protein